MQAEMLAQMETLHKQNELLLQKLQHQQSPPVQVAQAAQPVRDQIKIYPVEPCLPPNIVQKNHPCGCTRRYSQ